MYVFRVRDYKLQASRDNENVPTKKLEATTEHYASTFTDNIEGWIYFFVDLEAPEL